MIQSGILTVYVRPTSAYTNSRGSRFAPVWLSNGNYNYNNSNNGASALNANSNNSYSWGNSNDNAGSGLSVDKTTILKDFKCYNTALSRAKH